MKLRFPRLRLTPRLAPTRVETRVAGVTYENKDGTERWRVIAGCFVGDDLVLQREPRNKHDPNAIAVIAPGRGQIGYVPRELAEQLAPSMDAGCEYAARITDITPPILGVGLDISPR